MNRNLCFRWLTILALLLGGLPASTWAVAAPHAPYTVNTITDENDGSCNDGDCSLRDAILLANASPGPDTIEFGLVGCAGACPLNVTSALPPLSGGGTTLDGYSQPGTLAATASAPATLLIQLYGGATSNAAGLTITSAGNRVLGLAIIAFDACGVAIGGAAASGNVVAGNQIGLTIIDGLEAGNGLDGVCLGLGAHDNLIGGDGPAARNVIASNGWAGVGIHGAETMSNTVAANYIGVNSGGTMARPNAYDGVRIYGGAHDNTVGGDTPGRRNVLSGNTRDGVRLAGEGTAHNTVAGNRIGVSAGGGSAVPNGGNGVSALDGAAGNTIGGVNGASGGGACMDACNQVSGNTGVGVMIEGAGSDGNVITGNYIGTNPPGGSAIHNGTHGVHVKTAANTQIGGATAGLRNVISGNPSAGVYISDGASHTRVQGNFVGTTSSGASALGNANGVNLWSSAQNIIGGGEPGEGNLISGNGFAGVAIQGTNSMTNTVAGNLIGVNPAGTAAIPNTEGVDIGTSASHNLIGGTTAGERNLISGNLHSGVVLEASFSNQVTGNYIGTDLSGTAALGNGDMGVLIGVAAHENRIGGAAPGQRNIISGNAVHGVVVRADDAWNNRISGNYIGLDASGRVALGSGAIGVVIENGANNNLLGGSLPGEGNHIAGCGNYGVGIWDAGTLGNQVVRNWIGLDASGQPAGNGGDGVYIADGATRNLVTANRIANNTRDGVLLFGAATRGNDLSMNSIYNNDMGIGLEADAHGNLAAPGIVSMERAGGALVLHGKACPGCRVELFESHDADGEGERYVAFTTAAADGAFTFSLPFLHNRYLTLTNTELDRGTAPFSSVYTANFYSLFLPLAYHH